MNIPSPITIYPSKQKIKLRAAGLWALAALSVVGAILYTPVFYAFAVIIAVGAVWMLKYRSGAHVTVDHEGVKTYKTQEKFQHFSLDTINKVMLVHKFSMYTGQWVQTFRAVVFFDATGRQLGYVWSSFYTKQDIDALFMAFNEADRIERKSGGTTTRP